MDGLTLQHKNKEPNEKLGNWSYRDGSVVGKALVA